MGVGSDLRNMYNLGIGRVPNRSTDAGMQMLFVPGDAVCIYSAEELSSNLQRAQLAITDISATAAAVLKNSNTQESQSTNAMLDTILKYMPPLDD